MLIYAGIDEAGYGPLLGPLVVARSVFALAGSDPREPLPSLWTLMRGTVCRRGNDRRRRVAVNDSKQLFSPAAGLRHLERGVLSFLYAAAMRPTSLDEILACLAHDPASREITLAWYADPAGAPRLPAALEAADLEDCAGRLGRAWARAGVRLAEVNAAVVFEDRFNRLVRDDLSKAACSWRFVAGHLRAIWERYGEQHPWVIIDRQGGRRNYLDLLATLFPWTQLRSLEAGPQVSSYEVFEGARSMRIVFAVEGERAHLPVAYASMTAKYLRELLMARFNAYWQAQAPHVRATAGYHSDGSRFLRELDPTLARLGIDRAELARIR